LLASSRFPAAPAFADDGEVTRRYEEPIGRFQVAGQGGELSVGNVDDFPAALADEVLVGFVGEVVGGRSVTEVDVFDEADVLQGDELAVDGGVGHVRKLAFHPLDDVLGSQVEVSGVEKDLDGGPATRGGPSAVVA
jgi:hypothetical protein